MKFSPTVPTQLEFAGPPITPLDPMLGLISLPVLTIATPDLNTIPQSYPTLQKQFCSSLPHWQLMLYGSLQKAYSTNTVYSTLLGQLPVMLVSDALVQQNGQSSFAWVIAQDSTPL